MRVCHVFITENLTTASKIPVWKEEYVYLLLRLFIAALWSPVGKRLTSWLSFVMFNWVFVTFPCGILGQVWYLIVSIPDLCLLTYFDKIIFLCPPMA